MSTDAHGNPIRRLPKGTKWIGADEALEAEREEKKKIKPRPVIQPELPYFKELLQIKVMVGRLYDAQASRIAAGNRLKSLAERGISLRSDAEQDLLLAEAHDRAAEKAYERAIMRFLPEIPIWNLWLSRIHGVGPRLGGSLLAAILDPRYYRTTSAMLAYFGLHTLENPDHPGDATKRIIARPKSGIQCNWNWKAKMTAWKTAASLLKAGATDDLPYYRMYEAYKARKLREVLSWPKMIIWGTTPDLEHYPAYVTPGWEPTDAELVAAASKPFSFTAVGPDKKWTLAGLHQMSMRYMVKRFLSHLLEVWSKQVGHPLPPPYAFNLPNHGSHPENPFDFCSKSPLPVETFSADGDPPVTIRPPKPKKPKKGAKKSASDEEAAASVN